MNLFRNKVGKNDDFLPGQAGVADPETLELET